jgi:hypothetical protein
VFDGFRAPPAAPLRIPSWDVVDELRRDAAEAGSEQESALNEMLARWHTRLDSIGGEPTYSDWSAFRPLRLTREEDWSDWLAHLVATSKHGFLADMLLDDGSARAKLVDREVTTVEGPRADLVIAWLDGRRSHIEVKIGDLAFEKTYDTATALQKKYGVGDGGGWSDHILLPPADVAQWELERMGRDSVKVMTWSDVAVSLRQALWAGLESVAWRVWAASFVGATEQTRLGLPLRSPDRSAPLQLARILSAGPHLDLLKKAVTND